ncbi:helix-turn-helix domain-containing protein [Bdellovibrio sp.]|uniref:helix-turn-helix domain-containing protein n=1 Tax=Bdellovibrio sp. TaxID=28201 RepID=UPI0039C88F1E
MNEQSYISPDVMTTKEAAHYLRVSTKRLLNMVSQGLIPYRKLGRTNRYYKNELDQLLNENRKGPNYGNNVRRKNGDMGGVLL